MPYRRGQGLSAAAGPYIGDEISKAIAHGGKAEGERTMTRLLSGEHLQDQLGALRWVKSQPYVLARQVAVAGNSFGGIESVLGAENGSYCAAVDASGGAETWAQSPLFAHLWFGLSERRSHPSSSSRQRTISIRPLPWCYLRRCADIARRCRARFILPTDTLHATAQNVVSLVGLLNE